MQTRHATCARSPRLGNIVGACRSWHYSGGQSASWRAVASASTRSGTGSGKGSGPGGDARSDAHALPVDGAQADLAGNVSEWNLDQFESPYAIVPCNDCADLSNDNNRRSRGYDIGVRCVRLP
jgi:hypothetical protein